MQLRCLHIGRRTIGYQCPVGHHRGFDLLEQRPIAGGQRGFDWLEAIEISRQGQLGRACAVASQQCRHTLAEFGLGNRGALRAVDVQRVRVGA